PPGYHRRARRVIRYAPARSYPVTATWGSNSVVRRAIRAASVAAAYTAGTGTGADSWRRERRACRRHHARAHPVDVEGDETQPFQRSDQRQALPGRHATPGRRAHARRAGRIEEIHVEAQIGRAAGHPLADFAQHVGDAAAAQLDPWDDAV